MIERLLVLPEVNYEKYSWIFWQKVTEIAYFSKDMRNKHIEINIWGKFMRASPAYVEKALKGIDFPASKKDLVKHAKNNNASDEVMEAINDLPDKEYTNATDVAKEFKGD